jgi:hypothetical protein
MINIGDSLYDEKGHLPMKRGAKEMKFRKIFSGLDETGQDRLLDTAHALLFAAKTRTGKAEKPALLQGTVRQEHDTKPEFVAQKDEGKWQ